MPELILILAASLAAALVALRLIFRLPSLEGRSVSAAIPVSGDTRLGRAVRAQSALHPGLSGVLAIAGGIDAYAVRAALVRSAEASIDVQYYIWGNDLTGIGLLSELRAAALRGVRVRILLDDNGVAGLDAEIAALDRLPTCEVRLFNPFMLRWPRLLNYLFDFRRLNRRMHNKSLTVDGAMTVIGGRNIADTYFDTGDGSLFFDLDVLAAGPVAADAGADFDGYWNSASAYPVERVIPEMRRAGRRLTRRLRRKHKRLRASPQGIAHGAAVEASTVIARMRDGTLPLDWVKARLFSDDPKKGLGEARDDQLMLHHLLKQIGRPKREFDLISAYLIPGEEGVAYLAALAGAGVRVRTLTNALEATDVAAVHAGYRYYRDDLLHAGIEVFELRSEAGNRRGINNMGVVEMSSSALHAKSIAIDREKVFIGSFNFDPRSIRLNCEMGLFIECPKIAGDMSGWLDREMPTLAYRVTDDRVEGRGAGQGTGRVWTTTGPDGAPLRLTSEPNATFPLRATVFVISWLPVEWLL